jgi:hypothetical protein
MSIIILKTLNPASWKKSASMSVYRLYECGLYECGLYESVKKPRNQRMNVGVPMF